MTPQLHVESILHLSALSLVVSIAYLGLDKVHLEKDAFQESLAKARAKAVGLVKRCEVTLGHLPTADALFYGFPFHVRLKFYVLAHVAHAKIKMGPFYRFCHWCHRKTCVPFLRYFDDGYDRLVVSFFAVLSLMIFLYLTAAALWDFDAFFLNACLNLWFWCPTLAWTPLASVMPVFYWVCVAILVWIFATVGVTRMLKNLEATCENLQAAVDRHMQKMASDQARYALANQPDPPPDASKPEPLKQLEPPRSNSSGDSATAGPSKGT